MYTTALCMLDISVVVFCFLIYKYICCGLLLHIGVLITCPDLTILIDSIVCLWQGCFQDLLNRLAQRGSKPKTVSPIENLLLEKK